MFFGKKFFLILGASAALVGGAWLLTGQEPPPPALVIGKIKSPLISEPSGLASSRRTASLLWTHNDSGNDPVLFAITPAGELRGSIRVSGTTNVDWEDLASFTDKTGQPWLVVGDTGDNTGKRKDCALHLIAEPDPALLSPNETLPVVAARTIPIAFPDGPHDCEALAIDPMREEAFLLSKRETPPRLYSVSLAPLLPGEKRRTLQLVGQLRPPPAATSWQKLQPIPTGRYRAQPTAMDFAADGSAAVIVTYGDVLFFPKTTGETWGHALGKSPILLAPHKLKQAEATCFSFDHKVFYIIGEETHTNILRYESPKN